MVIQANCRAAQTMTSGQRYSDMRSAVIDDRLPHESGVVLPDTPQGAQRAAHSPISSPAEDHLAAMLTLDKHLVANPGSTFYLRVANSALSGLGILPQDLLVVDRTRKVRNGDIAVVFVGGGPLLRIYYLEENFLYLQSANHHYPSYKFANQEDAQLWGVVAHTIADTKKRATCRRAQFSSDAPEVCWQDGLL